ncbi:MAG: LamG domain-containing protein, partial [Kiritimatiellae bacterium]|nr:LamG domain-containing protein [Kiritimatiellia bacterium]
MKRLTKSIGLSISVCLLAGRAFADGPEVRCWYHFDEAATNTMTTADSEIHNAVSVGIVAPAGYCYSIDSNKSLSQTESVMPVYGEGFPHGAYVFDPLTGSYFENSRAMRFSPDGSTGAMVLVSNGDNWMPAPNDTYTAECFYKWEGVGRASWRPIMGCRDENGNVIWEMRLNDNQGKIPGCVTLTMRKTDGNSEDWHIKKPSLQDSLMDDGRWHHLALCVSQQKFEVYFDYVRVTATEISGNTFTGADRGQFFVGSDPGIGYGRFIGLVDEVRITKGALSADQFLQYQNVAPGVSDETALLMTFEALPENWIGAMDNIDQGVNLAPSTGPAFAKTALFGGSTYSGDSVSGSIVRSSLVSTNEVANLAAFFVATNSSNVSSSGSIIIDDRSSRLTDSSFTLEMNVKCGGILNSECWYVFCSPDIKLRLMTSSLKLDMYGTEFSNKQDFGGYNLADGGWHHVAMVYDQAAKTVTVFVDYNKAYSASANIPVPSGNTATANYTMIGAGLWAADGHGYNLSSGAYDNVRITRRALSPVEFQTSERSTGSALVWLGLDGNLTSLVNPTRIRSSSKGAFVSGGTAEYTPICCGQRIVDADGNVLKDNIDALSVNGGKAEWSGCTSIPCNDFTVELFYRIGSPIAYAGILEYSGKNSVNSPTWAIVVDSAAEVPS